MDRFSRPQGTGKPAGHGGGHPQGQEDFSEMVDATARKPGVFGKLLVLSLIVVSVAVTAFVGYAIVNGVGSQNHVDSDKYQAVFLSDGQIYFGKLSDVDKHYSVLEDIFYLQVRNSNTLQEGSASAQEPEIQLVKLGNEIHGPVDKMIINSDQILFWENLKEDGRVSEAINTYNEDGANDTETTDTTQDVTPTDGTEETETP